MLTAYCISWLLTVPTSNSFPHFSSCPVRFQQHSTNHPLVGNHNSLVWTLSSTTHSVNGGPEEKAVRPFRETLLDLGLAEGLVDKMLQQLVDADLLDDATNGTPETLVLIAQDFVERPEVFASLLMSDFALSPVVAHQVRAGVMGILTASHPAGKTPSSERTKTTGAEPNNSIKMEMESKAKSSRGDPIDVVVEMSSKSNEDEQQSNSFGRLNNSVNNEMKERDSYQEPENIMRPLYKSVIVNAKASKRRAASKNDTRSTDQGITLGHDYGLPQDYETKYPKVANELEAFYDFMTRPSTDSQEDILRPATASVYMRHAKQFLGWYAATHIMNTAKTEDSPCTSFDQWNDKLSLYTIFPDKERKSADAILQFILWLRSSREISTSYEANILRGLIKVLKFRFAKESQSDPSYGEKSFHDIPLIREIRKLHRDANKRQSVAPRSSDESQKWLSWPEYLQVVQQTQSELVGLLKEYKASSESRPLAQKKGKEGNTTFTPMQRKIATCYQRYLILAILSSVPDRQRTIRELEIGRSFRKEDATGCWYIKHAPEDYKTGKAYGERPLLQLSEHLTPWIDEFLKDWRQCLVPKTEFMFAQPRTGKPLTSNSVYQLVGRACYQCTGKRTNPHLLRDMLVTHVRESDASEKQLEALALYMGHSIQMQRSSYDRRTLTKKVAPAVELMQSVNEPTRGK